MNLSAETNYNKRFRLTRLGGIGSALSQHLPRRHRGTEKKGRIWNL